MPPPGAMSAVTVRRFVWAASAALAMGALRGDSRAVAATTPQVVRSPDGRIEVRISLEDRIRYDVVLKGKPLVEGATLSLDVDHAILGLAPRLVATRPKRVDQWIEPPVRQKA